AHAHVRAQTLFGDRAARTEIEQVFRAKIAIMTLARDLVMLRHQAMACFGREMDHSGMGHPRSIVTIAGFAFLVAPHFGKRFFVRARIVLPRNLSCHSAHRESFPTMTGLDAEQ